MKKSILFLFTLITLSLGWNMTVCASPATMEDGTVFDAEFYAQTYPDVAAAYGTDASALYRHYFSFGKAEGRLAMAPGAAETSVQPAAAPINQEPTVSVAALQVLEYTNAYRRAGGRSDLKWDSTLAQIADLRAAEASVLFSHTRPGGTSWYTALPSGYYYNTAGENLSVGYVYPDQVVAAWMQSPTHRENIMEADFSRLGIGCCVDENGLVYWSQIFAG